jgi:hypothetical protein
MKNGILPFFIFEFLLRKNSKVNHSRHPAGPVGRRSAANPIRAVQASWCRLLKPEIIGRGFPKTSRVLGNAACYYFIPMV